MSTRWITIPNWDASGYYDSLMAKYANRVTSEHSSNPKFSALVAAFVQPFADITTNLENYPYAFDLDLAVGSQLDVDGEWIGRSRNLPIQIDSVYFSFDIAGLGFDESIWKGKYDPDTGITSLDDEHYRVLLKAKIGNNLWDGSLPSLYTFMDQLFTGGGYFALDHEDMTMTIGLASVATLDKVTKSLLTQGLLDVKPAGVSIRRYVISSVTSAPVFGFGASTAVVGGFGTGAFMQTLEV